MNILITGGGDGLGMAISKKLAEDKSNIVYLTYHNSSRNAHKLEEGFSNVRAFKCDFRNTEEMNRLTEKMLEMNLDVLINNAITGMVKNHFHKIPPEMFCESFRDNVLPAIIITQQAIKIFQKKAFGKIITILSSVLVNKPPIGMSEYAANKAYLHGLSKSWATENARYNITANCVSPSFMQTNLTKGSDEREVENIIANNPLKRLLTVDEVANSVAFLVNSTQFLNGQNLVLNGGADLL